ncbi:phospholipase D family protein [Metapseudomonas otitidis]|uniref:phospholipase D family protein n=1 Tax=Metapseudomonas otitidis TaxID=319939 RepID=UPI001F3DA7C2|nr:phospholipase D family protein [Pseudomonas otitidis]MDG9782989.1 phospholipase D-like domain-containing protein [Pseudomonas otitidis]WAF84734.1 phospholipase D-like domain-containing protein [Pseudomonas otitidis]
MAKFLNTSATNYFLEELIKNAKDRLILISPFLKLNDRIKELLIDKDRLKIDVRIVYGKSELQPEEIRWLNELTYIRTSFCKNLHAKCYLNEEICIISSLNLYEFSQVNNNEMGVLIERSEDTDLYRDAYEEAQRIIRISEEVRISLERIASEAEKEEDAGDEKTTKLTTSKLGQRYKLKTAELIQKLVELGYLETKDGKEYLTASGKEIGGEFRVSPKFGPYFLWPEDMKL